MSTKPLLQCGNTTAVLFLGLASVTFALDTDSDGLDDTVETNTGVYVTPTDTGTDPNTADTDGDEVPDGLEVKEKTSPVDVAKFNTFSKGLHAYYPFDGDANDKSGFGRNGTVQGTHEMLSNGIRLIGDQSTYYNGGGWFSPHSTGMSNASFTLSVWTRSLNSGGSQEESHLLNLESWNEFGTNVLAFSYKPETHSFVTYAGINEISTTTSPITETINHFAITKDGQTVRFFLNGAMVRELTFAADASFLPTDYLSLNHHWWSGGSSSASRATGTYSNFRLYERSLTAEELGQLHQQEKPPAPRFQIIEGAFTWHDAKADAESRGGRLAVLDTQEKIDEANAFLNEINYSTNCWIGLTDELSEGQWNWITGNDLSASNWNSGTEEPNNGYDYVENYAMMAAEWQWRWNDAPSVASDISYLLELPSPTLNTSSGVGGNINIARDFDSPTATLTAVPNPGYIFTGWAGDASGITNPLVVTMDANKTITAIFIQYLAIALDTSGLEWSSDGGSPWFGQTSVTYDGVDSARSGAIWHNQDSWMETTVTGPGEISYWWKVSSERNYDYLEFYIDGVLQSSISGEVGWRQMSYPIASGSHTLSWRYQKDNIVIAGSDAAWVDQVVWAPTHTTTLTTQPGVGGNINAVRVFDPPTATLTAVPNPGYIFSGWTGDAAGTENPLTVTMNTDKTFGATFSPDLSDTDDDGLNSFQELAIYGTDPTKADTDGDGLSDGFEVIRYSVVLETLTWAQAKAHAEAAGGSLATFPNEITWNRARLAVGPDALLDINGLWIGATDSAEEGVWRWITGEPFDFTQWATGEPNDRNNSDYAAVAGDLGGEEGMWYDYRATTTRDGYGLALGYGTDPLVADTDGDGLPDGDEHTRGTNPFSNDTDSDGLQDQVEVRQTGTNPLLADTDGDSVPDGAEDSDGDGLTNADEVTRGTNPGAVDTDGDSLSDSAEVSKTFTDPLDPDSDDDGISDFDSDSDSDGLTNSDEVTRGTNPTAADTDGDGLTDGVEVNQTQTNPLLEDTDGDSMPDDEEDADSDGLTNADEVTRGTNPIVADTDADGMNDSTDVFPIDPAETIDTDHDGTGDNADADDDDDGLSDIDEINIYGTNPKLSDTDGDGLNDSVESNTGTYVSALNTGTNPNNSDTDADEVPDGLEVKEDTNPNNSAEFMGFSKGIQAYYALDGNANDLTGGGANGVARNLEWQANPVDSPGNIGAFLNPNSNLGGVLIQDHPSLHLPATGYTICGWVQSPDFSVLPNTDHYMYLIESQTIVSQQESAFALGYDAHGLFFQCGSLDNYPDSDPGGRLIRFGLTGESHPNVISSKQWHQIALVYDGNVFRGYLDGRELTPQGNNQLYLTAPKVSGRPTALGMRSDLVGQKNNGSIDEVRLYGRSLSGGEIKALYRSERPDFQIINGAFTWHEAKADAELRGGRLAVLDTQEKIDDANEIVDAAGRPDCWIGLTDEVSEGTWLWLDGTTLGFSNWGPGQPDNSYTWYSWYYYTDEDFAHYWSGNLAWNDLPSGTGPDNGTGYLLELPSTTTLNTEPGVGGRIDVIRGFNSPTAVLTAIPNPGYIFTTWTGDASGTDNPLTITVDSDKTIGATFSTDLSDTDGDGLNNYEEVTRGTNPMMADTDGDGLNDGAETNTGIYVSPQDTGTNPNNPDTDGDLFGDGYEISTLKNPIRVDIKPLSNLQINSVIDPEVFGDVTPAKEIQIENDTLAAWDSSGNGRIHLFDFKNGEIALRSSIDAPHTSYDWPAFGYSISMYGNRLLTGDHITCLSGIHDGRAYQYDISNLSTPVLQSTFGQDAQTATYIGAQVITVNGFSIISSRGWSGYGTENKVHIFREDGSFYRTLTEGYDQGIEFARSGSRDAFIVCRTNGESVSRIRIYDISEGEIVERASSPPPISSTATNPNEASTQFAYHRFAFDGTNILMVDVDFLRIFRPSNGQWIESSLDLRKYSGGSNFASTNILMTESSIFISSPKADCRDGNQGCVVIFDRVAGDAILRYRETLTRRSDSISGEFGSYVAYHEGSKHLVVSTEFGSTHAWDVVNTNQGKWAVYQTGNFKSVVVQTGANGRISGAGIYDIDSTVSLSAIPDPGYVFTTWTGDASGTDNPLTITVDSDKTIGATFSTDLSDTDGDGLNNYEEVTRGTNPMMADTDGDGLPDGDEHTRGTNPFSKDTDSDGLQDQVEVLQTGTNPLLADTDGDSVPDGAEDSDGDGLSNADEVTRGTNPGAVDTDGDSLSDSVEVLKTLTDPLDPDSDDDGFSDFDSDPDGDVLSHGEEIARGTDPNQADTDSDGLPDGVEARQTSTNPLLADSNSNGTPDGMEDSDGDLLTNLEELELGTHSGLTDTDGDGFSDWQELGRDRFELVMGSFTHAQAAADAAARGGYLATITSAEEQQAAMAAIDPALLEDLTGFWIGASDAAVEGEWRWGTGESFAHANWGTARPSAVEGNTRDFTEISGGGGAEIGNWYDRTATTVRTAYLLEKSFVTNPLAADTDGDGLDDAVEISHSTLPHVADTDGDGSWDGAEVEFGGAPQDGGNVPEWKTHIRTSAAPEPGVVISFPTLPGKSYSVYASSDLIEWQELRWLTGTGGVMSHSEPRGSHTSRFFKVEASDAPTNPDPVPAPTW